MRSWEEGTRILKSLVRIRALDSENVRDVCTSADTVRTIQSGISHVYGRGHSYQRVSGLRGKGRGSARHQAAGHFVHSRLSLTVNGGEKQLCR